MIFRPYKHLRAKYSFVLRFARHYLSMTQIKQINLEQAMVLLADLWSEPVALPGKIRRITS